jgi:Domain of unknown function (DUF955).
VVDILQDLLNNRVHIKNYMKESNINIYYYELPEVIRGFAFKYRNRKTIFINKMLKHKEKKLTLFHEIAHIEFDHFKLKQSISADECEKEVENFIKLNYDKIIRNKSINYFLYKKVTEFIIKSND